MRAQRAAEYVSLGERFLAGGDRVSAAAYFRDAISADPSTASAYVALGEVQLARGALRDAEETFRVGMARATPDARLWLGLVRVLDAQGHPGDADAVLMDATSHFARNENVMLARRDRAEARLAWSLALSLTRRLVRAAEERGDETAAREHRVHARALLVLVGEVDPVSASDASASQLRRVLSR
jgi:Tfp pilus assembly protein PilF